MISYYCQVDYLMSNITGRLFFCLIHIVYVNRQEAIIKNIFFIDTRLVKYNWI
jgi:hypothetical protein